MEHGNFSPSIYGRKSCHLILSTHESHSIDNIFTPHSVIEINVGIACACMPALPSFYHYFFPRRQTNAKLSYAKDSYGSRKTNPTANLGLDDAGMLQGKYIELGETSRRVDNPPVIYSSVRAEGGGIVKGKEIDPELYGADGGILRTIDVEQSISEGSGSGPGSWEDVETGPTHQYHLTTTSRSSR